MATKLRFSEDDTKSLLFKRVFVKICFQRERIDPVQQGINWEN